METPRHLNAFAFHQLGGADAHGQVRVVGLQLLLDAQANLFVDARIEKRHRRQAPEDA